MSLRKKLVVVLAATLMLALSSGPAAFAAPKPSGMGQPDQECGEPGATDAPPGFRPTGSSMLRTTTRVRRVHPRKQMPVVRMRSRSTTLLATRSRTRVGSNR